MNVLILGGTGFLGTRISRALAAAGHNVIGLARRAAPAGSEVPGVRFVQATIDDRLTLSPLLACADFVIHLAWDTTPGTSAGQPAMEAYNNVLPTLRFLEELQHHPNCALVFVSTGGALYGMAGHLSTEVDELCPRSYYGAAKGALELMLRAFHAQSGNTVLVLRPSNIYGPGQHAKRGFAVIPTLMQCARDGLPFELWGSQEATRDYLYVEDFERLVCSTMVTPWRRGHYETFNAGSGVSVPIQEILCTIEHVSERTIQVTEHPARAVDLTWSGLDCSRVRDGLGWHAITSLEEGLRRTWRWHLGMGVHAAGS